MCVQVFSKPEVELWDPFPPWSVSFLCLPGLISSPPPVLPHIRLTSCLVQQSTNVLSKNNNSYLNILFRTRKIQTKPLSPSPVLCEFSLRYGEMMEKMSDQIKNNNMFPDLDPKCFNKERGRGSSKYPINVVLISTWSKGETFTWVWILNPPSCVRVSLLRPPLTVFLRLLTFNCRVSVCLRKISGVPNIFPSQQQGGAFPSLVRC